MIRFQVAGRTIADIEVAIYNEMKAAGIPTNTPYIWDADGRCVDVSTNSAPTILVSGYTVDVQVKYP